MKSMQPKPRRRYAKPEVERVAKTIYFGRGFGKTRKKGSTLFCLEKNGKTFGQIEYLVQQTPIGRVLSIQGISVEKAKRIGIGKMLFREARYSAKLYDAAYIRANAWTREGIAFYKAMGMKYAGRGEFYLELKPSGEEKIKYRITSKEEKKRLLKKLKESP